MSYEKGRERQISLVDILGSGQSKSNYDLQIFTSTTNISDLPFSRKSITVQSTYLDSSLTFDLAFNDEMREDSLDIFVPAAKEEKMPEYVTVILKETSTEYIFELPSKTADKDTDEGNYIHSFIHGCQV